MAALPDVREASVGGRTGCDGPIQIIMHIFTTSYCVYNTMYRYVILLALFHMYQALIQIRYHDRKSVPSLQYSEAPPSQQYYMYVYICTSSRIE